GAFPTCYSAHLDVARDWFKVALRTFLIVEVDRQHRLRDLADSDVAHVDVLERPTAHRVVLESKRAIQARAIHSAVVGKHVSTIARDLAADGYAAMSIAHIAIANDDVLTGGA